jgi:hypothetical protein
MLIPLQFPPGVYRAGTEYQSKGRYYDANLVRWFEGTIRPVGGWRSRSASTVTGKARCVLTWTDNSGDAWIGIGTHSKLYAMDRAGTLTDITPSGFVPGNPDATFAGGYGSLDYGEDTYGTPRAATTTLSPASVWTLDTWGETLVGCMAEDGKIYEWGLNVANDATQISGSPTARAVVVTAERIMFALGAAGNPRTVKWSNQEDNTSWTASGTTQAGDFNLQTSGRLMCGKRVRGATLLLTDVDAHVATYQGRPFIYGFERVGTNCGVASQQGVAVIDGQAVWMGPNGFWSFDGFVKPLNCEVSDYVFSDINADQISKVYAVHNSAFGEVWWFYPSSAATEIDRYVIWNYRENHWSIGEMVRLCGVDRGALLYPLMVGNDGVIYEHEVGFDHSGAVPFVESGPMELGNGDNVVMCRQLIPDDKTTGQVTAKFYTRFWPNTTQTEHGPYTLESPTSVRFTGRQVSVRYVGTDVDWRVGTPRLEVTEGGLR